MKQQPKSGMLARLASMSVLHRRWMRPSFVSLGSNELFPVEGCLLSSMILLMMIVEQLEK